MKVIAAITSPAKDDLLEKILRHIGRWNAPWFETREARGPPPIGVNSSPEGRRPELPDPECSDRTPTDEDYCVDAPTPNDSA